jgi:2,4-dienoyl-CoA reductase-like NADH-dependent reductase (Old Yellow Enzyme family)
MILQLEKEGTPLRHETERAIARVLDGGAPIPASRRLDNRRGGSHQLVRAGRALLYDPRWPWHAAAHFGAQVKAPDQYLRSQPRQFPHIFASKSRSG